jgi:hypothetical protein
MSELLLKAKQNLEVAHELLHKSKHFAPVVHCSYYMCIQLMIHCLLKEGFTEQQIKNEIRERRGASHDYYIDKIFKIIISKKKDSALAARFNNQIKDLKAFREQSDYGNVEIDKPKANQSFEKSLLIKEIFRSALDVKL